MIRRNIRIRAIHFIFYITLSFIVTIIICLISHSQTIGENGKKLETIVHSFQ